MQNGVPSGTCASRRCLSVDPAGNDRDLFPDTQVIGAGRTRFRSNRPHRVAFGRRGLRYVFGDPGVMAAVTSPNWCSSSNMRASPREADTQIRQTVWLKLVNNAAQYGQRLAEDDDQTDAGRRRGPRGGPATSWWRRCELGRPLALSVTWMWTRASRMPARLDNVKTRCCKIRASPAAGDRSDLGSGLRVGRALRCRNARNAKGLRRFAAAQRAAAMIVQTRHPWISPISAVSAEERGALP